MTNVEAIAELRNMQKFNYTLAPDEVFDMTISALEKQEQKKQLTNDVTPIKCTGLNCPMQAGKVDPATCKAAGTCEWATKPLTNADRIRAMSDEQLADWLKYDRISVCPPDTGHIHCNISDICADRKCWLDWLKQEAEE